MTSTSPQPGWIFNCCGTTWNLGRTISILRNRGSRSTALRPSQSNPCCSRPSAQEAACTAACVELTPDIMWVDWDSPDRSNPLEWSKQRKWITTGLACTLTLLVQSVSTSYAMGGESMKADLGCSQELVDLGLVAYVFGCAVAPLALAPVSEVAGRYWVYASSAILWTLCFIPIALAKNIWLVIVFRFISGCAASTGSTLVGGTVADLFAPHERGMYRYFFYAQTLMALFSVQALVGSGLGAAYGGYIELFLRWRWIQWIQMILSGTLVIFLLLFSDETRGAIILQRRTEALIKKTGDVRYRSRLEVPGKSLWTLIQSSVGRPLRMLLEEPAVLWIALWIGFNWGVMYLFLGAVSKAMQEVYGLDAGRTGLCFLSITFGGLVGLALSPLQEVIYRRKVILKGPEARLYAPCLGAFLLPIGIWVFGFSQGRSYFLVPLLGLGIMFLGVFFIYWAASIYVADIYGTHASSALAAVSLMRNIGGTAFPLFSRYIYDDIGYQWASFAAGMVGLLLGAVPWILLFFGPKIRSRSKRASSHSTPL
ncbi:major facilitator superfamily domain-containing protein [Flagelloscypha sp. PMI_526]|nr:major facilitator superfamily domain-containing protein [Flagelloscypha sp. PMI_526]